MKLFKKHFLIFMLAVVCLPMLWIPVKAEENTTPEHVHRFHTNPKFTRTSTKTWTAYFYCLDNCGFKETVDCDVVVEPVNEATCTEYGKTYYNVSVDYYGNTYSTRVVDKRNPLGHDHSNGACSRCGEKPSASLGMPTSKTYVYTGEQFTVSASNADALPGEITYKYYLNYDCTVETTPENSGASENGGAPSYIGRYYITSFYAEDEYYKDTNGKKCTMSIKPTAIDTITVSNHKDGVKISWEYRPEASFYTIYRKSEGGSYQAIGTIENANITSCIDTSPKSGKYYYNVTVTQPGANGLNISSYKRANGKQIYRNSLTVTNNISSVKLKWNYVSGASGYYVYRKTKGQTKYVKVKTIKGASTHSWTDKSSKAIVNGRKSSYYVKAYFKKANYAVTKTPTITNYFLTRPKPWQTGRNLDWSTNKYATGYIVEKYDSLYEITSTYIRKSSIYKNFWPKSIGYRSFNSGRVRAYKEVNGVRYYSAWSKKYTDKRLNKPLR